MSSVKTLASHRVVISDTSGCCGCGAFISSTSCSETSCLQSGTSLLKKNYCRLCMIFPSKEHAGWKSLCNNMAVVHFSGQCMDRNLYSSAKFYWTLLNCITFLEYRWLHADLTMHKVGRYNMGSLGHTKSHGKRLAYKHTHD